MFQAHTHSNIRFAFLLVLASGLLTLTSRAQAPVFANQPNSSIRFSVDASIPIAGRFDKWEATLKFASPDVTTGSLDIKVYAASVDTGSGFKDDKLRSNDFFNADHDPYITFQSTKVVPTGPNTFSVPGTFTIRGVSKTDTLTLTVIGDGTDSWEIKGAMAFDRKDYGMGLASIRRA